MSTGARGTIFLSHTSANDLFVKDLRLRLEDRGFVVKEDSSFRAGDSLPESVRKAIDGADYAIGVVSAEAVKSGWVKRELRYAQKIATSRPGFRVIPLRLSNATVAEVRAIFELPEPGPGADLEDWPPELISIDVGKGAGAMDALIARVVDAIEGRVDHPPAANRPRRVTELADLVLHLRNPRFEFLKDEKGGEIRRPVAEASLAFYPPNASKPSHESPEFIFAAPLGKIEAADLSYYLERYFITPFGVFKDRADAIAARLPEWGHDLWSALAPDRTEHANVFKAWKRIAATAQRRFTIEIPPTASLSSKTTAEGKEAYSQRLEASTALLSLPWELLHDVFSYLFLDGVGVRVRRSLPGGDDPVDFPVEMYKLPLRVLIVCARPEDEGVPYIDHRVSVRPLTEALNALGDLASYDFLTPPTFNALKEKLREALARGEPYHIVHFDGHGAYDKFHGLGSLVFEHPDDAASGRLHGRAHDNVNADRLGKELRHAGVGLFFLEACESAMSEEKPEASVAGRLLQSGVASVAAMSHSVLVETARRFTEAFYPALARGERVGAAMLEGQRHLYDKRHRGWGWEPSSDGSGKMYRIPLELQDWFVPVLYQNDDDPVLLTEPPPAGRVLEEIHTERALALGERMPKPPEHAFVGRSRELLAAERLLVEQGERYLVLRGEGGEGKTTLACELARWLVSTRRMDRAVFASVENLQDVRGVLWEWGTQLVPDFASRAFDSLASAESLVANALAERDVVLVLDNVESILPPPADSEAACARVFDQAILDAILGLCRRLMKVGKTRMIFTSREALPAGSGLDEKRNTVAIGRLSVSAGMELVARLLAETNGQGSTVSAEALQAERDEEIKALVNTVGGHARSLVLLTPELARHGLAATTAELAAIMEDLERRYPGERERSLFASVELSLRRLPKYLRSKVGPLGVFQGGGNTSSIRMVAGLNVERDEEIALAVGLSRVGLVEIIPPGGLPYLRFDPALAPMLRRELRLKGNDQNDAEALALALWAQAYRKLADFLFDKLLDTRYVAHLTSLELPNLLAALRLYDEVLNENGSPSRKVNLEASAEDVIDFATDLETLLRHLGRGEALAIASDIRERAREIHERSVGKAWSDSAYSAAVEGVESLLAANRFQDAIAAAKLLIQRIAASSDPAKESTVYERAIATVLLSTALRFAGMPEEARETIAAARADFESLAASTTDHTTKRRSASMASNCIIEEGNCLLSLGQLEEAASRYTDAIDRNKELGDFHSLAMNKFHLGNVRLLQDRFEGALALYHDARELLESHGESAASEWAQIGVVHKKTDRFEEAEVAFQRALAQEVLHSDRLGEAAILNQLGDLYLLMDGKREASLKLFRRALAIISDPANGDDRVYEAQLRYNVAVAMVALGRFEEARSELTRASECSLGDGPNTAPWKHLGLLAKIEFGVGNTEAAADARSQAMIAYESARRQGWGVTDGAGSQLCRFVGASILAKTPRALISDEVCAQLPAIEADLDERLQKYSSPLAPPYLLALAPKLLAILAGMRDPGLAGDPALDYDDAVELKLLLELLADESQPVVITAFR
jgi:tetratricopeptide (TPR) repeat protein